MCHGYHGSFYGYTLFFYDGIKTFGLDSANITPGVFQDYARCDVRPWDLRN